MEFVTPILEAWLEGPRPGRGRRARVIILEPRRRHSMSNGLTPRLSVARVGHIDRRPTASWSDVVLLLVADLSASQSC
jgi:hypothetical protein